MLGNLLTRIPVFTIVFQSGISALFAPLCVHCRSQREDEEGSCDCGTTVVCDEREPAAGPDVDTPSCVLACLPPLQVTCLINPLSAIVIEI